MTPDRSHSDTAGRVANKVRVKEGETPFNPYFYVPKYCSSDALPAPEIFLNFPTIVQIFFYNFLENYSEVLLIFCKVAPKIEQEFS